MGKKEENKAVLLPCPFCGAPACGPENEIPEKTKDSHWRINCSHFCVSMYSKKKKIVVAQWNSRVTNKGRE